MLLFQPNSILSLFISYWLSQFHFYIILNEVSWLLFKINNNNVFSSKQSESERAGEG